MECSDGGAGKCLLQPQGTKVQGDNGGRLSGIMSVLMGRDK